MPTAPAEDAPRALQACGKPGRRCTNRELAVLCVKVTRQSDGSARHSYRLLFRHLSLQERAWAEQLYLSMCHEVKSSWIRKTVLIVRLSTSCRKYGGQNVRQLLAVPVDAGRMGIDQLFPVLPLEGLDQVPERALCCWILPVTLTVLSTTILM